MIKRHDTGQKSHPLMFLGRVTEVKDVEGQPGGDTVARFRVVSQPVGHVRDRVHVHFYQPPPGVGLEDNLVFRKHGRYVVIGRHGESGFVTDGGCGQTSRVSKERFARLVQLARAARNEPTRV